jgi:hypothetical protein
VGMRVRVMKMMSGMIGDLDEWGVRGEWSLCLFLRSKITTVFVYHEDGFGLLVHMYH